MYCIRNIFIYIHHLKFSIDIASESITMSQELHNRTPLRGLRISLLIRYVLHYHFQFSQSKLDNQSN